MVAGGRDDRVVGVEQVDLGRAALEEARLALEPLVGDWDLDEAEQRIEGDARVDVLAPVSSATCWIVVTPATPWRRTG